MSKASKQRHCPVLDQTITPADCGVARHSRHACPADCAFNPFAPANYEALLASEDALDTQTLRRLAADEPEAPRAIAEMARENSGHGFHAATVWRLFFRPDARGRTFAARWSEAGLPGLKNDQRVLLRGKMQMRVALLEFQQVLDGGTLEAVDLLDPVRPVLRIRDRQSAARMTRFATVLTWVYPLPHFWRMSGTGLVLPDLITIPAEEAILEWIGHLGGPVGPGPARALWLAENFCRIDEAVAATALERRRLMFSGMDAQFGVATYTLEAPWKKCRDTLLRDPDVVTEALSEEEKQESFREACVWLGPEADSGMMATPAGGRQMRGRVLFAAKTARLEAMGQARLAALRRDFEARLGPLARFTAERRDDLGGRMAGEEPAADVALVPPRLLRQPPQIDLQSSRLPAPPPGTSPEEVTAWLKIEFRRRMLEEPIPALAGLTPRQAAADPRQRPALLQLMKNHVRQLDQDNLETGRTDDINALLRELGLHEIDFPPPPVRTRPEPMGEAENEFADEADGFPSLPVESARPPAPVLTGPPLDLDEALDRLQGVMDSLDSAGAGLDELDRSGSTLMDNVDQLTGDWLSDNEFNFFVTFALQSWFALVPRGVRAPVLRLPVMQANVAEGERLLRAGGPDAANAPEHLCGGCRQPALLQALMTGIMAGAKKMPPKMRPSPQGVVGMLLALRALLDELDHALRAGKGLNN